MLVFLQSGQFVHRELNAWQTSFRLAWMQFSPDRASESSRLFSSIISLTSWWRLNPIGHGWNRLLSRREHIPMLESAYFSITIFNFEVNFRKLPNEDICKINWILAPRENSTTSFNPHFEIKIPIFVLFVRHFLTWKVLGSLLELKRWRGQKSIFRRLSSSLHVQKVMLEVNSQKYFRH